MDPSHGEAVGEVAVQGDALRPCMGGGGGREGADEPGAAQAGGGLQGVARGMLAVAAEAVPGDVPVPCQDEEAPAPQNGVNQSSLFARDGALARETAHLGCRETRMGVLLPSRT